MRKAIGLLLLAVSLHAADWFSGIRDHASQDELYRFLFALPKGGDLHHHNGLSIYAGVWYRLAAGSKRNEFFTLTKDQNCGAGSVLRFSNIQRSTYEALDACRKSQYEPLAKLSPDLKQQWLSALILDQPGEGRDEFFERIYPRFGDIFRDPYVVADAMVENMRLFGAEGVRYIEAQTSVAGMQDTDGKPISDEEADGIIRARLQQPDAKATGVSIRFQRSILRFTPNADEALERAYAWVSSHRDMWVGVNLVGREDNGKGYALRFLPTFRKLRRTYSDVPLSIHAGEKDDPGHEVRDTLLLGATRIGHGVNLISDPDTMLLMRGSKYLVEINLVSNRVLDYVPDPAKHPFPEYLRFGIPVCLNTDDRGSWDSNMTDEYFTAVTNYRLTWAEIVHLGRNSLEHAFAEPALKTKMLHEYEAAIAAFEKRFAGDWRSELKQVKPLYSGYARRTWGLHE